MKNLDLFYAVNSLHKLKRTVTTVMVKYNELIVYSGFFSVTQKIISLVTLNCKHYLKFN